jgi:hypothetical protein
MNESELRTKFRDALGEEPVPTELRIQTRAALKHAIVARRTRLQWVPAAIAAMLAIAIVGSLLVVGAYRRSHIVPATTRPTSKASPVQPAARGPIPLGTPVVIYWRSVAPDGLYASSWKGDLYKVPTLNFESGALAAQSPDGSRVSIGGVVYDTSTGDVIAHVPSDGAVTWADDSRHVCLATRLQGQGSATRISYGLPGSNLTDLGEFGSWAVQVPGATVLACSASSNRVVVSNVGGENDTSDVWAVDATSGAIGLHRSYPTSTKNNGNVGVFIVASPHGDYLAETDGITGSATIRGIAGNSVVTQFPNTQVHGFSWSGGRVLATSRQADFSVVNTTRNDPEILDWATRTTIWKSPTGSFLGGRMAAQPSSEGIAIDMAVNGRQFGIWLIGADGRAIAADQNIAFLVTELVGIV